MYGSHGPNTKSEWHRFYFQSAVCLFSLMTPSAWVYLWSVRIALWHLQTQHQEHTRVFSVSIFLCWKLCLACIQSRQRLDIEEKEGNYKVTNAWKICRSLDFFYTTHRKYEIRVPSLHCCIGTPDNNNHRNLRK